MTQSIPFPRALSHTIIRVSVTGLDQHFVEGLGCKRGKNCLPVFACSRHDDSICQALLLHAKAIIDSSIHMAILRPWKKVTLVSEVVKGCEGINVCESLSFPCAISGGVKSLYGTWVSKHQRLRVKRLDCF